MLTITRTSTDFYVGFQFNPHIVNEIKGIEGREYQHESKQWRIPVSQEEAVRGLMSKYGVKAMDNRLQKIEDIDPLPDLITPIPLKRQMFKYQEKGTARMMELKRCINGDDMGLGKTTQAIASLCGLNAFPALIVCPATLKENWQREFFIVAGIPCMILSDKTKGTWSQYWNVGMIKVFITNPESLKKFFVHKINVPQSKNGKKPTVTLKNIEFRDTINIFKSVTIDELHRYKNPQAMQTKLMKGICTGKEVVFGLTGTPVVNSPKDLMSQLSIVGRLGDIGGYTHFLDRYCNKTGGGGRNLKELNVRLNKTCFFMRQKSEVLHDLPDKVRQIVYCDITTRVEYDKAMSDLGSYLKVYKEKTDAEVRKAMAGEVMVRIGICKNIIARGKMETVNEWIDEIIDSENKVGVFIHQKVIADLLMERYPQAVSVRGDDPMQERTKNVDAFQNNDKVKLIVCSIKSAGVGITLTSASRMCFIDLPWHSADTNQCEDRFHRIGQKNSVQCTYFLGKDTIDEWLYEIIESKRDTADKIAGTENNVQQEVIQKIMNKFNH